jgi:hypothetical protein
LASPALDPVPFQIRILLDPCPESLGHLRSSPEQIITAYGMNPSAARLVPWERANEVIRLPAWNEELDPVHPWIRAGHVGGWAFGIDDGSAAPRDDPFQPVRELSRGTNAAWFSWNPKLDYFAFYANGNEITAFEPLLAAYRRGSDPDRFLPEMRQAGLSPDPLPPGAPAPPGGPDPRIALLTMLSLALGIHLPRETLEGPLLTVQQQG